MTAVSSTLVTIPLHFTFVLLTRYRHLENTLQQRRSQGANVNGNKQGNILVQKECALKEGPLSQCSCQVIERGSTGNNRMTMWDFSKILNLNPMGYRTLFGTLQRGNREDLLHLPVPSITFKWKMYTCRGFRIPLQRKTSRTKSQFKVNLIYTSVHTRVRPCIHWTKSKCPFMQALTVHFWHGLLGCVTRITPCSQSTPRWDTTSDTPPLTVCHHLA